MGFSATHHLGHVKLEVSAPKLIVEVNQWKRQNKKRNIFFKRGTKASAVDNLTLKYGKEQMEQLNAS